MCVQVSTWVFVESGVIMPTNDERFTVSPGSFKFSFSIDNWSFCTGAGGNPCQGESGEYIELSIAIRGPGSAAPSLTSPVESGSGESHTAYSLGGDVSLELSDLVQIDGIWTEMPAGYPRVDTKGGKQVFVFRLPKSTASIFYDPLIQGLGTAEVTQGGDSGGDVGSTGDYIFEVSFTASGAVEDYDTYKRQTMLDALARAANLASAGQSAPSGSELSVTAASVNVVAKFPVASSAAASSASSAFAGWVTSASDLTQLFASAGLTGLTVESTPVTSTYSSSGNDNTPVIIGAVVGGVAGLALLIVLLVFGRKRCGGKASA